MINRRTFIQQTALIGAGMAVTPSLVWGRPSGKIGLQLYTLRQEIVKDVQGVIRKVAAAGYQNVETYGYSKAGKYWGLDPKAFSRLLKENGLMTSSGHYDLGEFITQGKDDNLKAYIEAAAVTGQEYITVPSLPGTHRGSADQFKVVADKLNKAGEICKSSGLKIAYHNHAFEFEKFNAETGYDILLAGTEPSLVKFEMDIYWVVRAGKDPVALFTQHPGRFVMWHMKDMDKNNPAKNTELGDGSVDFKRIFSNASLSGVQHLFVEQENFSMDPFVSIGKSRGYMKNLLKRG